MAIIVNLFGSPGTGKSTGAAHIFSKLKVAGIKCEYISEYAKDATWENNTCALSNPVYVLGEQYHKIFKCQDQVDVLITDSPIMLSTIYNSQADIQKPFADLVYALHNRTDSINIFLRRVKEYVPVGRSQTEEESDKIAVKVQDMLSDWLIPYTVVPGTPDGYDKIVDIILKHLNRSH